MSRRKSKASKSREIAAQAGQEAAPAAPSEQRKAALARIATSPVNRATMTALQFTGDSYGEVSFLEFATATAKQVEAIKNGDIKEVESTLISQVLTLDAIFHDLAQRAAKAETLQKFEVLMRMALKAQSGSRSSTLALSDIRNPRGAVFAKQLNVAHQQQVNNGPAAPAARTDFESEQKNELYGVENATMDRTGTRQAGGKDTHLVAVGSVNRAALG